MANKHSDPVAMPTKERILACGVYHWYADVEREFLLSFDFANEDQGLIPVQLTRTDGTTLMGKYNGMTNEIVFEDDKENLLLSWSDEE